MAHAPHHLSDQLAAVGTEFYRRGWMLGTAGNLSARVDERLYLITASGGHKGRLDREHFLALTIGEVVSEVNGRRVSAETAVHDRLYASRAPGAVLHVHSPYVTLLSRACAARGTVRFQGWEYVKGLGFWDEGAIVDVPIVPNHAHIPALADAVEDAAADAPGVFVAGHGLYAWGDTVAAAQRHVECFEFLAHMVWEERRA